MWKQDETGRNRNILAQWSYSKNGATHLVVTVGDAREVTHAKTGWNVYIMGVKPKYRGIPPKYFKSRQKAISYAKNWIRKHPLG